MRDRVQRAGRLSESERLRVLRVFDELVPAIPLRPARVVEAELKALGAARHAGRRHRSRA